MISRLKRSQFFTAFIGKKNKNVLRILGIIVPNLAAVCLEGISFGCILLAFTALSGGDYAKDLPLIGDKMATLTRQQAFVSYTLAAILLQIFRSGFIYLGQVSATMLSTRIQIAIQKLVYKQLLRFSFPFVSRYKVGDLIDHAQAPALLVAPIVDVFHNLTVSIFAIMASLGIMFYLSPSLALLAAFLFGFFGFFQKFILRKLAKKAHSLTNHLVEYSKHLTQSLSALRIIHTFQRQKLSFEKVTNLLEDIGHTTRGVNCLNHIFQPLNEILGITFVGVFLFVGMRASFHHQAQDTLPLLLTFITIVHRLGARVQLLISNVSSLTSNWPRILRVDEILSDDKKEFAPEGGNACPPFKREISFANVSLRYSSGKRHALRNINLRIQRNRTIGFTGCSGAGKSSILDLIVRLYEPSEGCITFDGKSINSFSLESWRNKLAVVSQDNIIFNESIEENIRFGCEQTSLKDIEWAAKLANAHEFIRELPNGYQTVVGERGFKLSGGERQRIALARAIVRRAEILILDEATSSLDSHSEKLIQEALYKMNHSKTILLVAHRLSTVVYCDTIFVLDKGRVIESGSHRELLERNGQYASLWDLQSQIKQKPLERIPVGS